MEKWTLWPLTSLGSGSQNVKLRQPRSLIQCCCIFLIVSGLEIESLCCKHKIFFLQPMTGHRPQNSFLFFASCSNADLSRSVGEEDVKWGSKMKSSDQQEIFVSRGSSRCIHGLGLFFVGSSSYCRARKALLLRNEVVCSPLKSDCGIKR